jgi:HAD superfamily phosphoserine phosphatase-like hydrolase
LPHQGLVVFDVDGTLIREKTVCEVIATKIDKVERMDWLERNAGSSRASHVGPPEDLVIDSQIEMADWYVEAGREAVDSFIDSLTWAEGAHAGIKSLIDSGWLVTIASMTWSFGVEKIAAELGVEEFLGAGLDWDTKHIDHVFPEHKVEFLQQTASKHGIPADRIYAIGDSGGDVPMLKAATKGFYLGDSDPQIPGVFHLSNARIDTVARRILAASN